MCGNRGLSLVVVGLVVLALYGVVVATPSLPEMVLPAIVDWTQLIGVAVVYIGGAMLIVMGCALAFWIARSLFHRLMYVVDGDSSWEYWDRKGAAAKAAAAGNRNEGFEKGGG